MDTQLSRKRWVIPCSLDSKFPLPKELWLINVLINNKFEILHQLGLSVSGWAAWKAELTWLENIHFRLQQLNLVYVSLQFCVYSRVFLRPKYTMPSDSGEVKKWSRRRTALVCESNPVPKGCFFLRFCVFVRFSLSHVQNRGAAWLVTVAVQRGGCYKSLKWILDAESTYLFWSVESPFFIFSKN